MMRTFSAAIAAVVLAAGCASSSSAPMGASAAASDAWVESGRRGGQTTALVDSATGDASKRVGATGQDAGNLPGGTPSSGGIGLVLPGALNANGFRAKVAAGVLPQTDDLPMEGWLNEHDTPLPAALPEHPVELHAMAAIVAELGDEPEVLLQLGFNTAATLQALQPRVDVVVAIDRSASVGPATLKAMTAGVLDLADNLPPQSSLTVVAFDAGADTVFSEAAYTQLLRNKLKEAIEGIKPSGGTDLYAALDTAQKALNKLAPTSTQRRILLVTDGASTIGEHGNADFVDLGKKGGISISTIGLGGEVNGALLANLAKFTGGTYFAAPTLAELQAAFGKDLASLLVPVASNLAVTIDLASGWTVRDSYGLVYTQIGTTVVLGGVTQPAIGDAVASQDVATMPDAAMGDVTVRGPAPSVVSQLYPSQKNGMVALRLQPKSPKDINNTLALLLATANWSYQLTKTGEKFNHTRQVEVTGMIDIPDTGLEFYTQPLGRRTLAIVRAGEAMRSACALAAAGQKAQALAVLEASIKYGDRQQAIVNEAKLDPLGAIDDALGLTDKLRVIIGGVPKP